MVNNTIMWFYTAGFNFELLRDFEDFDKIHSARKNLLLLWSLCINYALHAHYVPYTILWGEKIKCMM